MRVGLLRRAEAGACPNLLQRRSAAGSAVKKSAKYQRFSSGAPARSGPLQQIWTNGAAAGPCTDGGRGDHPAPEPPRPPGVGPVPGRRDVHFALERALLTAHLECKMHISTITGPTHPSPPRTASVHTILRRPRPTDHDPWRERLNEPFSSGFVLECDDVGRGAGAGRYAPAAFPGRRITPLAGPPAPARSARVRGETGRANGAEGASGAATLCTAIPRARPRPRLLRPFPSATPLDPPLYEKRRRSGG